MDSFVIMFEGVESLQYVNRGGDGWQQGSRICLQDLDKIETRMSQKLR